MSSCAWLRSCALSSTTRRAASARWLRTVTQNALADFVAERRKQCRGSGDDRVLFVLESVPARDDLLKRLKEQFDHEIVGEACTRAGRASGRRPGRHSSSWRAMASRATTWPPGSK